MLSAGDWSPVLFEFGECGRVEANGVWLADRERLSGAYPGIQDVLSSAEGATSYAEADVRGPDTILGEAARADEVGTACGVGFKQ